MKLNVKAFTLIELLIVIAIIAIMAGVVFVTVNPLARFQDARNSRRAADVESIVSAVRMYQIENKGSVPTGLDSSWRMLGTDSAGCDVVCGGSIFGPTNNAYNHSSQSDFSPGSFSSAQWNNSNSWLELISPNTSGFYTSPIISSNSSSTTWTSLSFVPQFPNNKELPNNTQSETAYPSGNVNMSGNIALLHFNETVGAISFSDSSGSGNSGTCAGSACPIVGTTGKLNGGVRFDGVDDVVTIKTITPVAVTTVMAWFKSFGSPRGGYHIVSGSTNMEISIGGSGFIRTGVTTNSMGRQVFNSGAGLTDGKWHFVAMTYGGGYLRAYIDGVQTLEKAVSGNLLGMTKYIGNLFPGSNYVTNGYIDEFSLYSRVLSSSEILDRYKRGATRLKFQVRSCSESTCSTAVFVGPDGTAGSYYSELTNSALDLPIFNLTNIAADQYFQYKTYLETDKAIYSPALKSLSISNTIATTTTNGAELLQSPCLDLTAALGSKLNPIPQDPSLGSVQKTFYAVNRDASGKINARACGAEGKTIITGK